MSSKTHHFRLYRQNGSDAGTFTSSASTWKAGETLADRGGRQWRITSVVPSADPAFRGVLVVQNA
jgi:hypothetical protein